MVLLDAYRWFTSEQGLMALVAENWVLGIAIVCLVIFCETGLVITPFLPGDSLLFTTGAFLGAAAVDPVIPIIAVIIAAFLGDATNYSIGRSRLGQRLVTDGWVKPAHIAQTRAYFERYGGVTVTIGRFIPIVRTIAPFMAGLSGMNRRRFTLFNGFGAIIWAGGVLLAGFLLGTIPWVRANIGLITLGIVVVSVIPVLLHAWQLRSQPADSGSLDKPIRQD